MPIKEGKKEKEEKAGIQQLGSLENGNSRKILLGHTTDTRSEESCWKQSPQVSQLPGCCSMAITTRCIQKFAIHDNEK